MRIGDVGEQEGLAPRLRNAAAKLPTHQRHEFGILVDRLIDGIEQIGLFQSTQMIAQIRITAPVELRRLIDGCRHVSPSSRVFRNTPQAGISVQPYGGVW